MCIHFRLVLEDSVRNIAVEDINGIVLCQHRYIGVIDLVNVIRNVAVQILNFILIVSGGQVRFPSQFTGKIDGMQTHFNTLITYFSGIGIRGCSIFKSRCDGDRRLYQHVSRLLQISIEREHNA